MAGKRHAGIGRYVENLIIRLPQLSQELQQSIHWVFFFNDEEQVAEFDLPDDVEVILIPYRHYSVAEQIFAHAFFTRAHLDLLHIPHFNIPLLYRGKILLTIHDLLWHEYKGAHATTLPMWKYRLKYQAYLFTVRQAIHRANWILVPAETVKKIVVKYYPLAQAKTEVTSEGIAKQYQELISEPSKTTKTKRKKQLIYVGSLYPHKNVIVAIQALAKLPDFTLILAGNRNVFQNQVRQQVADLHMTDRVEFRGYLSDAELIELYQESFALIQPSLSEGFGLTGVEAMAAGIPVIASHIPIFQEIYGQAPIYFDPLSSDSFVNAVEKLDLSDWPKLIEKGKQVATQYDWHETAIKTLQAYIRVLK